MDRKSFIKRSVGAVAYISIASTLLSCVEDFIENNESVNEGNNLKSDFKSIYLIEKNISLGRETFSYKTKSDKNKIIVSNFTVFGFITLQKAITDFHRNNHKIKIVQLNDIYSCIIYIEPLQVSLPKTFRRLSLNYIDYQEIKADFSKLKMIF